MLGCIHVENQVTLDDVIFHWLRVDEFHKDIFHAVNVTQYLYFYQDKTAGVDLINLLKYRMLKIPP